LSWTKWANVKRAQKASLVRGVGTSAWQGQFPNMRTERGGKHKQLDRKNLARTQDAAEKRFHQATSVT